MSELTRPEIEARASYLVPAISEVYGEMFRLAEEPPPEDSIADFELIGDSGHRLLVQHKRTYQDQDTEFVADAIRSELLVKLRDRLGVLEGVFVALNLSASLAHSDLEATVDVVSGLVYSRYYDTDSHLEPTLTFRASELPLLARLPRSIGSLDIFLNEDAGIVISCGGPTHTPRRDPAQGIQDAVSRASEKYGTARSGVLLVLEPKTPVTSQFYLDAIRGLGLEGDASTGFSGVWIIHHDRREAICLTRRQASPHRHLSCRECRHEGVDVLQFVLCLDPTSLHAIATVELCEPCWRKSPISGCLKRLERA